MSEEYSSICNWLNGHRHGSMTDFDAGLAIIDSYIPHKHAKIKLLRSDQRMYELFVDHLATLDKKKKLEAAPAIATIQPSVIVRDGDIAVTAIQTIIPDTLPAAKLPSRSQQIDELESENKLLQKNLGYKHAQMSAIGRNRFGTALILTKAQKAERQQLRDEIVALEERIRANWLSIQFIQVHGHLPELPKKKGKKQEAATPIDFQEVESNRKMISYLQGQIRQKEAKLKKQTGEEYLQTQRKMAKQQKNLDERIKLKQQWEQRKN